MPIFRCNLIDDAVEEWVRALAELSVSLQQLTYLDVEIATIEDFCTKIRERLDTITFEGKRCILEMLDVRGTLAIENDEKVIYVSCLIATQPVSLALILPLSSLHWQNSVELIARFVLGTGIITVGIAFCGENQQ